MLLPSCISSLAELPPWPLPSELLPPPFVPPGEPLPPPPPPPSDSVPE